MTADTQEAIDGLLAAGRVVRATFDCMQDAARPGVTTAELDQMGASVLNSFGAQSAPQLFYDFPGATCISVNEHAAHGIPGNRILQDGDMVNIDVSAEYRGFVADMGESFVVGEHPHKAHICDAVRDAVQAAIAQVRADRSLNVIGQAVSTVANACGYRIVQNLGSHGLGRTLHEEPSYVPTDNPYEKRRLTEGLVLTIEPFFTTGKTVVDELDDGWTLAVERGELVAQFEHTLIVTREGALVVTA